MIRLKGPRKGEPGSRICLKATGIGKGFSVVGEVGKKEIPVTVTIDPSGESATICFTLPPAKDGGVNIIVSNSGGGRGASHTVLSL